MIPTTKFADYSQANVEQMMEQISEFHKIFEDANVILTAKKDILEKKTPKPKVEVVASENASVENCVWIDPSVKARFTALKDVKMPLHQCLEVYDGWFDQLYKLTIVNDHALHKKHLFTHVAEILVICSTFHLVLQAAMGNDTSPPTAPRVG
jgi:hypothetical protein